jgi:hypothetical protein
MWSAFPLDDDKRRVFELPTFESFEYDTAMLIQGHIPIFDTFLQTIQFDPTDSIGIVISNMTLNIYIALIHFEIKVQRTLINPKRSSKVLRRDVKTCLFLHLPDCALSFTFSVLHRPFRDAP